MGVVAAVLAIGFTRASSGLSAPAPPTAAPIPTASPSAEPGGPHIGVSASPVEVDIRRLNRSNVSTEGAKPRKHLDKLAEQELGATPDMLYKNALLPLKGTEIKVYKDGFDGGWCWALVAPDLKAA